MAPMWPTSRDAERTHQQVSARQASQRRPLRFLSHQLRRAAKDGRQHCTCMWLSRIPPDPTAYLGAGLNWLRPDALEAQARALKRLVGRGSRTHLCWQQTDRRLAHFVDGSRLQVQQAGCT